MKAGKRAPVGARKIVGEVGARASGPLNLLGRRRFSVVKMPLEPETAGFERSPTLAGSPDRSLAVYTMTEPPPGSDGAGPRNSKQLAS